MSSLHCFLPVPARSLKTPFAVGLSADQLSVLPPALQPDFVDTVHLSLLMSLDRVDVLPDLAR